MVPGPIRLEGTARTTIKGSRIKLSTSPRIQPPIGSLAREVYWIIQGLVEARKTGCSALHAVKTL